MSTDQPALPGVRHKLYRVYGLPVRFDANPLAFPERLNPRTGEWEVFHELSLVMSEGEQISEQEFNALVDVIRKALAPVAPPAESSLTAACQLVFEAGKLIGDYGDPDARHADIEGSCVALKALQAIVDRVRGLGCQEVLDLVERERQAFEGRVMDAWEKID